MARVEEIRINQEKCIGCGTCESACFTDVIRVNQETGKAEARYLEECEWCLICEENCPAEAIYVKPKVPVVMTKSY